MFSSLDNIQPDNHYLKFLEDMKNQNKKNIDRNTSNTYINNHKPTPLNHKVVIIKKGNLES
jgi:hypothetical protein